MSKLLWRPRILWRSSITWSGRGKDQSRRFSWRPHLPWRVKIPWSGVQQWLLSRGDLSESVFSSLEQQVKFLAVSQPVVFVKVESV